MTVETIHIEIPRGVKSASGRTIAVGFPPGLPIPEHVEACGDGIHAFKPLTWRQPSDEHCVCGTVAPGLAIWWCEVVPTILMLDRDVSHAECEHDDPT